MRRQVAWKAGLLSVLLVLGESRAARATTAEEGDPARSEPKTAEQVLGRMTEARKAIRSASYTMRRQTRYVEPVYQEAVGTEDSEEGKAIAVPAGAYALSKERFVVDGPRFRYERRGPIPYPSSAPAGFGLGPDEDIWTFDGKVKCRYAPDWNMATVWHSPLLSQRVCKPLMDYHYGLETTAFASLAEFRLAGKEDWEGRACYVLVMEVGPLRVSHWIDPERGWVLLRELREVVAPEKRRVYDAATGLVRATIETIPIEWTVKYEQDDSGIWRPAGWIRRDYNGYGPGRPLSRVLTTVVEETRLNVAVPPSTFSMDLPDGTRVRDVERGVTYIWDGSLTPEQLEDLIQQKVAEREERERREQELLRAGLLDVGHAAPDFEVQTLDGRSFRLSDFRGKYVLLNFWAAWCAPCVVETPHLKSIYDTFGEDERFAMIGLSLDKDVEAPRSYVGAQGLKWIQGVLGDMPKTSVRGDYGVRGIPAFFLVGPDGTVLANGTRVEELEDTLRTALGKK